MLLLPSMAFGQCPTVFDFFGNTSATPTWYNCSGNAYTLNLQSPNNWGPYEINWGDGTPNTSGASWNTPSTISHVFAATVDVYTVTITETSSGCVITGSMIMEESSSASIQIPVGGLTQACAPQLMEFINSSTNVSQNTIFIWDFGDGSPTETYDYTNLGQTISHVYEQGTVDCETEVSLTASNACNTIQGGPSEATFNPIRIWDIDDAAITASATLLCYPDTTVTFTNTTQRNCLFQGNIFQRYEYWNFGDYWGQGYDSIIDWTPWPPTFPHTIAYPGIGTYEVMMLDSNFCGIDTANITIQIVPPPTAALNASTDTICVGEPISFFQQSTGGGNSFQWNFGDGVGWLPTGGGNITYVYNNPGTYQVCTRASVQGSSAACADTACLPVVVLPAPVANIGFDDLDGCDSITVDFSNLSTGAVDYQWTFTVPPFSFNGEDPPPVDFTSPGNYVVTLLAEGINGCLDSDQEVVHVYASPVVDFLADNVCEGEIAQFTDFSTSSPGNPITSWQWQFGDGDQAFGPSPEHVYQTAGSFDVTLSVNTANCSGLTTQTIDVEPAPDPDISSDINSGCSPLTVEFFNNSIGATNYAWNFGDGSGSNLEAPTHTFINTTSVDTTYIVVMTAYTAFGCGSSDTLEITVLPGALASFIDNTTPPSCAPFDAQFINTSTGASSYFWTFGDGATSTQTSPSHLYTNTTSFVQNYDVTLIAYASNGCNDTTSTNVIVYPTANFDFTIVPDSACSPLIVTMPFIQGINLFQWDFGDGTPGSTAATPTHIFENFTTDVATYTVELIGTSAFGCVDTAYSSVQVNPQPIAQFSADITNGCGPLTVTFENFSIQADSYAWIYAAGDTSYTSAAVHQHTFENLTAAIVTYYVELIAISDDGCTDSFVIPIQVYPQTTAGFLDPGDGCHPYAVNFANTSTNANSYQWNFGNGIVSVAQNPSTTFLNPTMADSTYTVSLIAVSPNGCSDTTSLDVIVHPVPVAQFSLSNEEGCHPSPTEITNNSSLATSYEWDYGDGFASLTDELLHTHILSSTSASPVTYFVSLTAITPFGCTDTYELPYTVYPLISADFEFGDTGCSPVNLTFSNQSLGGNAGFQWNFGNGLTSSQTNPSTYYVNNSGQDTTYQVTLIASSIYGCTDTITHPVEILATPIADASILEFMGCYPLDVVFANNSIGADTYQWVYGTGETSNIDAQTHPYTYYNLDTEPVTYNVTLNAYTLSGCTSQDQLTVEVLPLLVADADANNEGCSPLTVEFQNNTQGALTYYWDFGDGTTHTIAEPTNVYTNDTNFDVVYNAFMVAESYYGCTDTVFFDITVYATPEAHFNATPASQQFPNTIVSLENLSIVGSNAVFTWDMGDGTILNGQSPPDHDYGTWGEYTITLSVTNGFCDDEIQHTVEIIPPLPIADFVGPASGCAPLTVNFQDLSEYATGWFWTFGDGGTATVANPSYTYFQPGTYTVSLGVNGIVPGTTDQIIYEAIIEVYPSAIAAFTVTPDEVSVPGEPIYCINLSQNATSYEWDFGDGETSTLENPEHFYQEVGLYIITLTANNEFDCPTTYSLPEPFTAKADGDIVFPNAFTPNNSGANGGSYDNINYSNDVFFPIHKGVIEYQLQIFNKWGELLFESVDVKIGWDGYYKGEVCKQDVYAWKVKARFVDGEEVIKAGDVTLLLK